MVNRIQEAGKLGLCKSKSKRANKHKRKRVCTVKFAFGSSGLYDMVLQWSLQQTYCCPDLMNLALSYFGTPKKQSKANVV